MSFAALQRLVVQSLELVIRALPRDGIQTAHTGQIQLLTVKRYLWIGGLLEITGLCRAGLLLRTGTCPPYKGEKEFY